MARESEKHITSISCNRLAKCYVDGWMDLGGKKTDGNGRAISVGEFYFRIEVFSGNPAANRQLIFNYIHTELATNFLKFTW